MRKYQFSKCLDPLAFQDLVNDLIRMRDGLYLEVCKESRDGGIDGLYRDEREKVVVQAKRWSCTFARALSALKREELPKVKKLSPTRYILGISLNLSQEEKEQIREAFAGFILHTRDILDEKDINELLRDARYKGVERAFPQLWLPGTTALEELLDRTVHRTAYRDSGLELANAVQEAKTFVPTRLYREAARQLEENHVVILSGEPGIGKTTMAYMMALAFLQPDRLGGFVWARSLDTILDMLSEDEDQVFILDDFWGHIFYGERGSRRSEAERFEKLIRLLRTRERVRLILTTREYVFQEGLLRYPRLSDVLDKYKIICELKNCGDSERAMIFFSHLNASPLPREHVRYLLNNSEEIVLDPNYNPRVLSMFLREYGESQFPAPWDYFDALTEFLCFPESFWREIFLELPREAREAAFLLLTASSVMRLSDLETCYNDYLHSGEGGDSRLNFGECLSMLEKTMVRSWRDEELEEVLVEFVNPSAQDFLYEYMMENRELCLSAVLSGCHFFNQRSFLLKRLGNREEDPLTRRIEEKCIEAFEAGIVSYWGLWNAAPGWEDSLDVDAWQGNYRMHRVSLLLRVCKGGGYAILRGFVQKELESFARRLKEQWAELSYYDLFEFPEMLKRCAEMGMIVCGEEVIDDYFSRCCGALHLKAFTALADVFPAEYAAFLEPRKEELKRRIPHIILEELQRFWYEGEIELLDLLKGEIEEILSLFGAESTDEFRRNVYEILGYDEEDPEEWQGLWEDQTITREERELQAVMEKAEEWLLGAEDDGLEIGEIAERVKASGLTGEQKKEFLKALDVAAPWYLSHAVQREGSLELLLSAARRDAALLRPASAWDFFTGQFVFLAGEDEELGKALIRFCRSGGLFLIQRKEWVVKREAFTADEAYTKYLEGDERLREIVFRWLIKEDGRWFRFTCPGIFFFALVMGLYMEECIEGISEEFYEDMYLSGGDGNGTLNDFASPEGQLLMYRLSEELFPEAFNRKCVAPALERFLARYPGDAGLSGDSGLWGRQRAAALYKELGANFQVNLEGWYESHSINVAPALAAMECLGVAEGGELFPGRLTGEQLSLIKREAERKDGTVGRVTVVSGGGESPLVQEETPAGFYVRAGWLDGALLSSLGLTDRAEAYLHKLEALAERFRAGDYSKIEEAADW